MRATCVTSLYVFFFFQAEDGIRDLTVTGVQTCALPILEPSGPCISSLANQRHSLTAVGQPPLALVSAGAFDIQEYRQSARLGPISISLEFGGWGGVVAPISRVSEPSFRMPIPAFS